MATDEPGLHAFVHASGIVSLAVGSFVVFITTFFFLLGSWVESTALKSQITEIVQNFGATCGLGFLSQSTMQEMYQILSTFPLPNMEEKDAAARQHNDSIRNGAFAKMYPLGFGLMILGMLLIGFHSRRLRKTPAWSQVSTSIFLEVLKALLMLVVICGTEIAFALLITKKYQTVPPSWVKKQVVSVILAARPQPVG